MSATNLNRIAMVLAFAGIFVAGFLSLAHVLRGEVPCGSGHDCAEVAKDARAIWFGQPVAYYGLAGYLILALLAGARSANGVSASRNTVVLGTIVSGIGVAASAYLTYLALVILKATCPWCLASAGIMVGLFVVHLLMLRAPAADDANASDVDFKLMIALGLASTVALIGSTTTIKEVREVVLKPRLDELTMEELVPADAHILGAKDAPITVVEFADLTCATCRQTFPRVDKLIQDSKGKIRLVFRHLPLPSEEHKLALPAAIMAEMAGEKSGRFWEFLRGVYGLGEPPTIEFLWSLAETNGLKREDVELRLKERKKDDKALLAVQRDLGVARKLMPRELVTPAYIVFKGDGRRHNPKSFTELEEVLKLPEFQ